MQEPDEYTHEEMPGREELEDYQTYLIWKNDHINNERKLLSWIRTSIALITLGFIVERLELFLQNSASSNNGMPALPPHFHLVTIAFFALGGIMIVIASREFFLDRQRINKMRAESTSRLDVLIVITLILLVVVTVMLLLPR